VHADSPIIKCDPCARRYHKSLFLLHSLAQEKHKSFKEKLLSREGRGGTCEGKHPLSTQQQTGKQKGVRSVLSGKQLATLLQNGGGSHDDSRHGVQERRHRRGRGGAAEELGIRGALVDGGRGRLAAGAAISASARLDDRVVALALVEDVDAQEVDAGTGLEKLAADGIAAAAGVAVHGGPHVAAGGRLNAREAGRAGGRRAYVQGARACEGGAGDRSVNDGVRAARAGLAAEPGARHGVRSPSRRSGDGSKQDSRDDVASHFLASLELFQIVM